MALDYLLTYAGVPFVGDASTLVRMVHNKAEMETPEHLPPLKHQPMEDLIDELDKRMPFGYLQDFSLPAGYPGRNTGALDNTQNPTHTRRATPPLILPLWGGPLFGIPGPGDLIPGQGHAGGHHWHQSLP